MSASVIPPPPPDYAEDFQPPLPSDPPPLPMDPPPPGTMPAVAPQYQYSAPSAANQYIGGNAAYPFAYQAMYQCPLQHPYQPQAHSMHPSYSDYYGYTGTSWRSVPGQQSYSSVYQPVTVAANTPHPTTTPYQPASAVGATAPGIVNQAPISFSLNGVAAPRQSNSHFAASATTTATPKSMTSFSSSPATIPAPASTGQDSRALKEWIRRGLSKYSKTQETEIRNAMKVIIEEKKRLGAMYTHDWDREPIPNLSPPASSSPHSLAPQPVPSIPPAHTRPKQFALGSVDEPSLMVGKNSKKKNKKRKKDWSTLTDKPVQEPRRCADLLSHVPSSAVCQIDENIIITGTCQDLEKSFLRLNVAPRPEEVRPEAVLIRALDRLAGMIAGGEKDFMYIWSQLKAIRQDLTVQHIKSETAVRLEELFARTALEHGDQQEFRKCVSTLHSYYDEGLQGCKAEFGAYMLLLYTCIEQKNRSLSLTKAMSQLVSQGVWKSAEVKHAKNVFDAVNSSNFARFWKLYSTAPNCSRLVMDWGIEKVRFDALKMISESFKTVPVEVCMGCLGFAHHSVQGGGPLEGCTAGARIGAATVVGNEAERRDRCIDCIKQHEGVVVRGSGGQLSFDAKVSKVVKPPPMQNSAKAVGNTHLNAGAFIKDASRR